MQKINKFLFMAIIAVSSAIFIPSCEDNTVDIPDFTLFTAEQDVELGAELDAEIRANPDQFPILNDAQAELYLQNMVDNILKSDEIEYRDVFVYDVTIIHDDETVNALAAKSQNPRFAKEVVLNENNNFS